MLLHLLLRVPTKMNAHLDQIIAIESMALALTILDHTNACLTQATDFHTNSKEAKMEMQTQMDTELKLMIVLNNPTIAMLQMPNALKLLDHTSVIVTWGGQLHSMLVEHVKTTMIATIFSPMIAMQRLLVQIMMDHIRVHVTLVLEMPKTNLLVMQKALVMYPTT